MVCKCSLQLLLIYERLKNPLFENSQNPGKKKKKLLEWRLEVISFAPCSRQLFPPSSFTTYSFSLLQPWAEVPSACNTDGGTKLSAGTAASALFHLNLSQTVKLAINLLIPHKEFFLLIWNLCSATLQVVGM